eukprot:2354717-Amphidinium_carterae.1
MAADLGSQLREALSVESVDSQPQESEAAGTADLQPQVTPAAADSADIQPQETPAVAAPAVPTPAVAEPALVETRELVKFVNHLRYHANNPGSKLHGICKDLQALYNKPTSTMADKHQMVKTWLQEGGAKGTSSYAKKVLVEKSVVHGGVTYGKWTPGQWAAERQITLDMYGGDVNAWQNALLADINKTQAECSAPEDNVWLVEGVDFWTNQYHLSTRKKDQHEFAMEHHVEHGSHSAGVPDTPRDQHADGGDVSKKVKKLSAAWKAFGRALGGGRTVAVIHFWWGTQLLDLVDSESVSTKTVASHLANGEKLYKRAAALVKAATESTEVAMDDVDEVLTSIQQSQRELFDLLPALGPKPKKAKSSSSKPSAATS